MLLEFLGLLICCSGFFFFNDTATTEIYTLSLHDALPISDRRRDQRPVRATGGKPGRENENRDHSRRGGRGCLADRKSTRLNSSHSQISYAVFCLKKKKKRLLLTDHRFISHCVAANHNQ